MNCSPGSAPDESSTAGQSPGFESDVAMFASELENNGAAPFTGNHEVDSIMVQSIQVLRFHLLELEKVHELCDSFCSRYIACLRGKMPIELAVEGRQQHLQLPQENPLKEPELDIDDPAVDEDETDSRHKICQDTPIAAATAAQPVKGQEYQHQHQLHHQFHPYGQHNQENLLAIQHPIQAFPAAVVPRIHASLHHQHYQNPAEQLATSPISSAGDAIVPVSKQLIKVSSSPGSPNDWQQPSSHSHRGSTPRLVIATSDLSAEQDSSNSSSRDRDFPVFEDKKPDLREIERSSAATAQAPLVIASVQSVSDRPKALKSLTGTKQRGPKEHKNQQQQLHQQRKRGIFPKCATNAMRAWLFQNLNHPYPSEEQKRQLTADTGLTILQVNNWFINARRRIVQPMIDQPNHSAPFAPEAGTLASFAGIIDQHEIHQQPQNIIEFGFPIPQSQQEQQQQQRRQHHQQALSSSQYQNPQYQQQQQQHQMMLMSPAHYMYTAQQNYQHQHLMMQHIPVPNEGARTMKPES